ncbi:hypothetical protein GKR48_14270 [Providencia sp. wls1943]|uniref:hypothetical protein n=1 Tax=Providencia sp. wls1943 TaxID=2675150 RepID=UPI0012B5BB90|nr:hypothetical protein [Providencia sp. wls1943]MTB67970.1 hypothetical protein [Providencia sp. wls1943]
MLGKRFERLLFLSIIVIILSIITYSLSKSVSEISVLSTTSEYKRILKEMNENEKLIVKIKEIVNYHVKFNEEEELRLSEFNQKNKISPDFIASQNEIRKKVGLNLVSPTNEEYTPTINFRKDTDLITVNDIRKRLGLEEVKDITLAKDTELKYLLNLAFNNTGNFKNKHNLMSDQNWDFDKIKIEINKEIESLDNMKVSIYDIDTPVHIPFKIGDLKTTISIVNIQSFLVYFMPVFISIWIGTLYVTRYSEIILLKKIKNNSLCYPHILNIYACYSSKKNCEILNKLSLDVKSTKKEIKSSIQFYSITRVVFIFLLLSLIGIPTYLGIMNTFNDLILNSFFGFFMVSFFFIINIIQLISFLNLEATQMNHYFYHKDI